MKICHYTSIEKAFGYIPPTQKLNFSSIAKTNDPYEVNFHWFCGTMASAFGNDAELAINAIFNKRELEKKDIIDNIRISCFASSLTDDEWDCSNNHHLWTHYASDKNDIDSGCGLIFDSDYMSKAITESQHQLLWHNRVQYCEASDLDFYQSEINPGQIFCKKPIRWDGEAEYRYIVRRCKDVKGPTSVDITDSLVGICLNGLRLNNITDKYQNMLNGLFSNKIKWLRRVYDTKTHSHNVM